MPRSVLLDRLFRLFVELQIAAPKTLAKEVAKLLDECGDPPAIRNLRKEGQSWIAEVQSRTNPKEWHLVRVGGKEPACTCDAFLYREGWCYHMRLLDSTLRWLETMKEEENVSQEK